MTLQRIAVLATASMLAFWLVDDIVMAVLGGPNKNPADSVLFLIGLASCALAATTAGMLVLRARRVLTRIAAAVFGVVVVGVAATVASIVVDKVQPAHPGWFWGEINLWAMALAVVVMLLIAETPARRRVTAAIA